MSTRGTIGFVVDGEKKLTYNHSDSYPSWLGVRVLEFLQRRLPLGFDDLVAQARALQVVDENTPPTKAQQEALRSFANTGVSTGSLDEWYVLLREAGVLV